jgi:signal peptidase I
VTLTYTAGLVSRRPLGCLFEIVETLVLTLIIFFVIQTFVAQPYRVEQQSMERTLEPDQYVLVDKLTPRFDDYKRGDIVIFDPPATWVGGHGTPYIKRIVGLPGDTVTLSDGLVYVDGVALQEPYLYEGQPTVATGPDSTWVVPPGQLFVMGDHREDSADSRVFGPIPRERVIGRAWLRYWPISTFGVLPTPSYPELAGTTGAGASSPAPGSPEASPSGP